MSGQQSPQGPSPGQSSQQKARAVIDKMIAALGGQAYLNVQDSYTQGRYGRFHNESMVATQLFYRYWKWPDSERYEITPERDIAYLFLADKEFEITFRGGHELDPERDESVKQALMRRRFTLERVLRGWLNDPGTIVIDEGASIAESQMTERITVINSKNEAVTLMISADAHLPVQKIFSVRDPQTHYRDEEVEIYGGWRMVDGINTPWSIQVKRNGALIRSEALNSVVYNTHPPDSYFVPKLINHERDKK